MNLIYDRTAEDVERALALAKKAEAGTLTDTEKNEWLAGMKGCYNATDMNRVEAAVQTLAAELNAAGYAAAVEPVLKGGSRLPSGYTQLEYIESTGEQYIDTGVVANTLTSVAMNFEWLGTNTAWMTVFGSYDNGNYFSLWHQNTSDFKAYMGTSNYAITDSSKNISLELSATKFKINSTEQTFSTTIAASSNLYLFHISNGQDSYAKAVMRLYSCIIYNGDTPIRKFIPVKNASGTAGLYDLISGSFFANAGTGVFTAGAEISALEDREWRETDIVRLSQWRQCLANVQALRDAYYTLAETGQLPGAEDRLGYHGANAIEKVLADIDLLIGWMKSSYRRCGTFQAGNNAAHLPLKGSA